MFTARLLTSRYFAIALVLATVVGLAWLRVEQAINGDRR